MSVSLYLSIHVSLILSLDMKYLLIHFISKSHSTVQNTQIAIQYCDSKGFCAQNKVHINSN